MKGQNFMFFLMFFLFNPPRAEERPLRSWHRIGRRNTKISIHGASRMEPKHGKCWKLPIFEGKLPVSSVIWVKWKQSGCSITLAYSSTFYSLFLPFFVLEIFKFKYDKFFVRHPASISKFEWFEQPWLSMKQDGYLLYEKFFK